MKSHKLSVGTLFMTCGWNWPAIVSLSPKVFSIINRKFHSPAKNGLHCVGSQWRCWRAAVCGRRGLGWGLRPAGSDSGASPHLPLSPHLALGPPPLGEGRGHVGWSVGVTSAPRRCPHSWAKANLGSSPAHQGAPVPNALVLASLPPQLCDSGHLNLCLSEDK